MLSRFTVERHLGSGGQGRVLAVADAARGDALVALKETESPERLRHEFGLLSRLRHPNLVRVYDWFERSPLALADDPDPPAAYTQELVEGTDLFRALREASETQREHAFIQILRALGYLHALDIFHLDLKPDNVLVTMVGEQPLVRVLDFGVARRRGERAAVHGGSHSYIAPEVLAGADGDERSDLYALGVMIAEVVSGAPPTPAALAGDLLVYEVRRRWLAACGVPPAWLDAVTRMTARDPRARPGSAVEAAQLVSRARRAEVALHTPATVAAMVRAGEPVGRDAERARCRDLLRVGGAVVLTGEAGSGRTTLARVSALDAQIAGHRVESWPMGANRATIRTFADALARLLGDREIAHRMGDTKNAPGTAESAALAGEDAERYEAWVRDHAEATARQISGLAESTPRPMLVVDDLDNAPRLVRATVQALVRAAESGEPLPMALVVVASVHSGASACPLGPLDREAVGTYLETRFGAPALDDRLIAALAAASGGQPLLLESLAALLVERGHLGLAATGWRWDGDMDALRFPDAVDAAVAERVGLLSEPARTVLGALAWLRYPALPKDVGAVLDHRVPPHAVLLELEAAGLVWRDARRHFVVAHPRVKKAVASWSPADGDAAAHARVVARGAARGALPSAWHLGGERGARLAEQMGREAWRFGDLEAAEEALDLALELQPDDVSTLRLRAEVANLLGPRTTQIACLERLIASLPEGAPTLLDTKCRLFWALTRVGDVARAEAVGTEVVALARAADDTAILAEALVHLAITLTQRGDFDGAERLLVEARQRAASGRRALQARIENNLGNVLAYRERPEEALTHYRRARDIKRGEGDPIGERIALGNIGLMQQRLGEPYEAFVAFSESFALAARTQHKRGVAWSLCALSDLALRAGAWRYAIRRGRAALDEALALGDQLIATDAETTLAEAELALGDHAAARRWAKSGLARATQAQNGYTAARARLLLTILDAQAGDPSAEARAGRLMGAEEADGVTRTRAAAVACEIAMRRGDLDATAAAARVITDASARAPADAWTAVQALRLLGQTSSADALLEGARAAIAKERDRWPIEPPADSVDDGALVDGPCRSTYERMAAVRALLGLPTVAPSTAGAFSSVVAAAGDVTASSWASLAVAGEPDALLGAVGDWVAAYVERCGAERAFLVVDEDARVLAARDADGELVHEADRKLPVEAVKAAREHAGWWRATGKSGRGAVASLALSAGAQSARIHAVIVLQNRFSPEAFAHLAERGAHLDALGVLLRLWRLETMAEVARIELSQAESKRRASLTRSTEEILKLRRELETTREQLGPAGSYPEIVFASAPMKRMLRQVDRVVSTDLPVHLYGESGTGKELVARAIHQQGARAQGPFVAQNCSAVPHALFESEFFGHERGAFTGANRAHEGLFRRASGGTLFLDEIGDLPLELQAKLLRVLETSEVRSVGGRRTVRVDVRIISATHHDLRKLVSEGGFREDLFYRLNVIRIAIPPVRERPDDIPVLANHFLALRATNTQAPPTFGDGVMKRLVSYSWPGNVRQLENEITRAALLADGGVIKPRDLSEEVLRPRRAMAGGAPSGDGSAAIAGLDRGTLKERVDRLESHVIEAMLKQHGGNKSQVARVLGLSRAGLNLKLKRLGLWRDDL